MARKIILTQGCGYDPQQGGLVWCHVPLSSTPGCGRITTLRSLKAPLTFREAQNQLF